MNNVSAPNPLCWLRQGLGDAARILAEWQETKVVSAWAGTWLSAISKSMILQDADLGQHFLLASQGKHKGKLHQSQAKLPNTVSFKN